MATAVKRDLIKQFATCTESQLVLGAHADDLALFYKAEPQRLVGMTNNTDACEDAIRNYQLKNTPWMFLPTCPNYTSVASFSDDIPRAWGSESSARAFLTNVLASMSLGGVFFGLVPDGNTRRARRGNKIVTPFGVADGQNCYMVFKSSFKTLAEHVGFVNVTISMVPDTEMFSFSMNRPDFEN